MVSGLGCKLKQCGPRVFTTTKVTYKASKLKLANLDIAGNSEDLLRSNMKIEKMPYAWSLPSKQIVSDQEQWSAFSHNKTMKATRMSNTREVEAGISCSC